jgi:signal peptidase I
MSDTPETARDPAADGGLPAPVGSARFGHDDDLADGLTHEFDTDSLADEHSADQHPVVARTEPPAAQSTADAEAGAPAEPDTPTPPVAAAGDPPAAANTTAAAPRRRWWQRKPPKPRKKAPWWELPVLALVAIVIAVVVKTWIVQPFYIPSASMEKTLHGCPGGCGDRILVNKTIYDIRDPHPGDIVVFHAPPGWDEGEGSRPPSNPVVKVVRGFGQLVGFVPPDGLVLVKRVIAVGGQTVKGDAQGHVFVSNTGPGGPWRQLDEPYVYRDGPESQEAVFGPLTVPKGRLWVEGDHRNDSADSRYHCVAPNATSPPAERCDPTASTVPDSNVIGKAVFVIWPISHWRTLGTPATFAHAALPSGAALIVTLPIFGVLRRRRRLR